MVKHKPLPSREELLEHLRYDPETGLLWWLKGGRRRSLSRPAGSRLHSGMTGNIQGVQICINWDHYLAHRIIWRMVTGNDPGESTIDHINRNPLDNRLKNLRLADSSLQNRNQGKRANSVSAYKGVCFDKSKGKWKAKAWLSGKTKHIGYFSTEQEAAIAAAPYFIH